MQNKVSSSYQASRWGQIPGSMNYQNTKEIKFYTLDPNQLTEEHEVEDRLVSTKSRNLTQSNKQSKLRMKDPIPSNLKLLSGSTIDFNFARNYTGLTYILN
jgi:hypothetical protein